MKRAAQFLRGGGGVQQGRLQNDVSWLEPDGSETCAGGLGGRRCPASHAGNQRPLDAGVRWWRCRGGIRLLQTRRRRHSGGRCPGGWHGSCRWRRPGAENLDAPKFRSVPSQLASTIPSHPMCNKHYTHRNTARHHRSRAPTSPFRSFGCSPLLCVAARACACVCVTTSRAHAVCRAV